MITCTNCNHTQKQQNFCSQCGSNLQHLFEQNTENINHLNTTSESNEETHTTSAPLKDKVSEIYSSINTEKAKSALKPQAEKISSFWSYFIEKLKKPSKNISEGEFKNGLASSIIALILWVLIPFFIGKSLIDNMSSSLSYYFNFNDTLDFGSFIKLLLYLAIFYAITLLITLLFSKKYGNLTSTKLGIAKIGALNSWMILAFVFTLILVLLDTTFLAFVLFSIFTTIFIFLTPLFLIVTSLKENDSRDPFLRYLAAITIFIIFYGVISSIFFSQIATALQSLFSF